MKQPTWDPSLRSVARLFLERRIGRRAFVSRLTRLGLTGAVAQAVAGRLHGVPSRAQAPGPIRGLEGLTGGELMAEFLLAWEVPYVFGLGGSEEVGFLDALVDRLPLQYVLGLHENAAVSMADGYARASGRPAFVNLHSVAGTAYGLGAMVNAFKDRTPLVVTAGRQSTRIRGQNAFLEAVNLHMIPRDYTRWTWDVLRAETIPEVLRRAFLLAEVPPGGPTFVTFSKDLWEVPVEKAEILPLSRSRLEGELGPDPELVKRLGKALREAQLPVLLAGRELARYGGVEELAELAELLGAPVFADVPASHSPMVFPTTHPLYGGPFTLDPEFPPSFDLFWSVGGTMFTLFQLPPAPLVPGDTFTAHLSLDAEQLGRNYPVDVALLASPQRTLQEILEELRRRPPEAEAVRRRRNLVEDYHRRRRRSLERQAHVAWDRRPIASERLAMELNRRMDPQAIVVSELATSDHFLWTYLDFGPPPQGRTHLTSAGGCLGWGLGAAIGAKIAQPDREVVLLVGDGSLQFSVQALWSAARYQVPVAVIVWNNDAYQANRRALYRYGKRAAQTGKYIGCYLGAPSIRYPKLAEAYGVEAARVEDPAQLGEALDRCLQATRQGRPYLLDVALQPLWGGADSTWYDFFSVARRQPRQS